MSLADLNRLGRFARVIAVFWALLAAPASAQTPVKFSHDWAFDGSAAFLLHPLDRGYFKAEGLDVTIDDGANVLTPITRVASGTYDMGLADINALIRYRDQNPGTPMKAVFMVYNKPPYAIVARRSRGISGPLDLVGKRLAAPQVTATTPHWPLYARLNNIDVSKVTLENVGIPVRTPMLAAGQVDAALGYSFRVFVDLKDRGVDAKDIVLIPMADDKFKLYGSAIIVNPKFAAERPNAVRGFVKALMRGLRETVRSPSTAVEAVLKRDELAKRAIESERLRMAIRDNIVTPEVKAHGYGDVDAARLDEAIGQIAQIYSFKAKPPKAGDIFDASFLPAAADRKVN
jgi:NitT/TauT family transport system substrate-binding protein